jgi:GntR family transcriptional regulator, transcriptional repressor for pyruvate dehydrogenase complex
MPVATVFAQTLTRSRLSEEIVSIIQKQIMSGDIAPGAKLPTERDLAESFKVNRTTLREALRKLESLELIDIRHGDGVYAKDFLNSGNLNLIKAAFAMDEHNETIFNVLEVRRIVAPEMAALAAQRHTADDLAELERIISHHDLNMLEEDIKVHQMIARATRNPVYTIMQNFIYQITREYSHLYFKNEDMIERTRKFHHRLFNAIKSRDASEARRVMLEGMVHSEERLRKYLAQNHK